MGKAAVAEKPKAGGGGSKAGASDESPAMGKAELKQALKFARQAPVRVAFALDAEGKAVLSVDRRKPARSLMTELKDGVPGARNLRFGSVEADPDNAKLLRFSMNKAAGGGMARKLVVALKGTGFSKVELGSEDGEPPETHEEPDEEEAGAGGAAGQAAGQASGAAQRAGQDAPTADVPIRDAPAQDAAAPKPGAPDAGQLVAKLTPLVRQMLDVVGKHPEQKAPLQKLATEAQTSLRSAMLTLKPEDLEKTAVLIDRFGEAVGDAVKAPAVPTAANGGNGHAEPNGKGSQDQRTQPKAPQVAAALTKLAQKAVPIMRADPSRAAPIKEQLTKAHASLKLGDLVGTLGHMKGLGGLLGPDAASVLGKVFTGNNPLQAGTNGSAATAGNSVGGQDQERVRKEFEAAAKEWEKVVGAAEVEAKRVMGAFAKAFASHGAKTKMTHYFENPITQVLHASTHLQKALAGSKRDDLQMTLDLNHAVSHVRDVLSHPLLAAIDSNPIVPVKIRQPLLTGLDMLGKALSKRNDAALAAGVKEARQSGASTGAGRGFAAPRAGAGGSAHGKG